MKCFRSHVYHLGFIFALSTSTAACSSIGIEIEYTPSDAGKTAFPAEIPIPPRKETAQPSPSPAMSATEQDVPGLERYAETLPVSFPASAPARYEPYAAGAPDGSVEVVAAGLVEPWVERSAAVPLRFTWSPNDQFVLVEFEGGAWILSLDSSSPDLPKP